MPELPEVETVRRELEPHVVGRRITGLSILWDRMVHQPSLEEFCHRLVGRGISGVRRRGKYLIFSLDSGETLIIHLKMTGSLLIKPASAEPGRFIRAVIYLDGGQAIHFRDPRKFGAMWLVADEDSVTGGLGPEPLEGGFTPQILGKLLGNRTAPLKALLCDQNIMAGIGNMYADEALFRAGVHPLRPGGSLSAGEIGRLHRAIGEVLREAINEKGASTDTYIRPGGELGTAHFRFRVAHQRGKNCPACGTPIQRIVVRNRGTYLCPKCQPSN